MDRSSPAEPVAKRKPGRPRADRRLAEDPREKLIRVAIPIFARHGFEAVSTGDIARAAGFSQPMVHYHFKSKERIWRAAMDALMRDLGRRFPNRRDELKDLGPIPRLQVMTRRFILMSAADPTLSRVIVHESLSQSDRLAWLVRRYIRRAFTEFDAAIQEGIASGEIKPLPVYALANTIISASSLTFCLGAMVKQVHGVDLKRQERIDEVADTIVGVLFEGLRA